MLLRTTEIDLAFAFGALEDEVVAKARGISEIAQLARLEQQLIIYTGARWAASSENAVVAAGRAASRGASAVERVVAAEMEDWADAVGKKFSADMKQAYRLARLLGARKGTGATTASMAYPAPSLRIEKARKPVDDAEATARTIAAFDVIDDAAVASLERQQLMWIGRHYAANVSDMVARSAELALRTGLGRSAVGEQVRAAVAEALTKVRVPGGFNGSERAYFHGLAGNAVTVARANGQMRSFEELGFDSYVIVNPDDERTCPVCAHLNDREFKVSDARRVIDQAAAATTPEGVRKAHPWIGEKRMIALAPTPGAGSAVESTRLARAGFCLPPFHFRCRCAVDIA